MHGGVELQRAHGGPELLRLELPRGHGGQSSRMAMVGQSSRASSSVGATGNGQVAAAPYAPASSVGIMEAHVDLTRRSFFSWRPEPEAGPSLSSSVELLLEAKELWFAMAMRELYPPWPHGSSR